MDDKELQDLFSTKEGRGQIRIKATEHFANILRTLAQMDFLETKQSTETENPKKG